MTSQELEVAVVVSAPFQENSFILWLSGRGDCLVVDPGLEPDRILEFLDERGLRPAAILNTHGHADHIAGNAAMKERYPEAPLVIGVNEADKLVNAKANLSAPFGFSIVSPPADELVADGQVYSAAGFELVVYEIPGHSSGHVVFVTQGLRPQYVIGGDVIMAGSIGRTDFPDGSFDALARGIHKRLFTLPDDTVILPGHGELTTVGDEKAGNPFVGRPAGWRG